MTITQTMHSPGPWTNDNGAVYSVPLDEIVMVTLDGEAEPRPHHRGLTALVYGHHVGPDRVYTHDGNARLIAAAPEMLALIAELADGIEVDIIGQDWLDKALALLAKIEGR